MLYIKLNEIIFNWKVYLIRKVLTHFANMNWTYLVTHKKNIIFLVDYVADAYMVIPDVKTNSKKYNI